MVVATVSHPCLVVGTKNVLHLGEEIVRDKSLVLTRVAHPLPVHDPDVEGVGEHLGKLRDGDRGTGLSGKRGGESLGPHRGLQLGERVLAGGVQAKHFPHEKRPLGIQHHAGDLLAGDPLAGVEIAQRRFGGPASHLGLLAHALLDL
ncbi:MAG: hypothetical protein WC941_10810 [Candidatus Bathyarchaeia archaeon]